MKIYLCGGMHNNWQDSVTPLLNGHEVLDPRSHGLTEEKAYTEWDLNAIRKCDAVLAFMDRDNPSGYGLNLEIGFAYALKKPVYFVMDHLGDRHKYFGMARACSRNFGNFNDAIEAMLKL